MHRDPRGAVVPPEALPRAPEDVSLYLEAVEGRAAAAPEDDVRQLALVHAGHEDRPRRVVAKARGPRDGEEPLDAAKVRLVRKVPDVVLVVRGRGLRLCQAERVLGRDEPPRDR